MGWLKRRLGRLLQLAGGLGVLGAVLVLGVQIVTWLKSGQWPPIPLGVAVVAIWGGLPITDWQGAQRLIDLALKLPLALVLLLSGLAVGMGGMDLEVDGHSG